jgi:hypothetical protein
MIFAFGSFSPWKAAFRVALLRRSWMFPLPQLFAGISVRSEPAALSRILLAVTDTAIAWKFIQPGFWAELMHNTI